MVSNHGGGFCCGCPPAYVVRCHDVQHLGGLYPHQIVAVLQQGLQTRQAACGDREPFEYLLVQKRGHMTTHNLMFDNRKVPKVWALGLKKPSQGHKRLLVEGLHTHEPSHLTFCITLSLSLSL